MGFDSDFEKSPAPKLSFLSLPNKPQDPPGLLTPPIHTLASVPFQWEEAPGKPRLSNTHHHQPPPKSKTARCLELPPRLLNEAKVNNVSSPTTVLDGPYLSSQSNSLTRSSSLSFRNGKSFSNLDNLSRRSNKGRGIFWSSRWGSFRGNHKEVIEGSIDLSSSACNGHDGGGSSGGDTKVKVTRVRRKFSFFSFSSTRSHSWTNIYESFKQVVPRRGRQRN
ncbi:hypothetical protein JCGZ_23924 [Jatropha curcas]|uniref:Uncharacterized protein n=1 Tax=Jatropha curcas TaxID=180498 RepID=A0A067K1V7_JATCU|nr:uncharacterized protein At4g00950 [Jatropha curcas]KDP25769.1 hypothetical protein JCGZ_23924 [Jatropha curcas]